MNYIVSKKLFVKTPQNRYGVFMEYDEGKLLAKTAIVSLPQALSRQLSQGQSHEFDRRLCRHINSSLLTPNS